MDSEFNTPVISIFVLFVKHGYTYKRHVHYDMDMTTQIIFIKDIGGDWMQ